MEDKCSSKHGKHDWTKQLGSSSSTPTTNVIVGSATAAPAASTVTLNLSEQLLKMAHKESVMSSVSLATASISVSDSVFDSSSLITQVHQTI